MLYLCKANLKNIDVMIKIYETNSKGYVRKYKVSFNFRAKTIHIWAWFTHEWCRYLKATSLTSYEMRHIAEDFTGDDLRNFIKNDSCFSIWR